MPAHQRLGTEDRDDLQDRRKPTIELDEESAIVVRKLGPPSHLASQDDQLMSERRILCLKSALRLEWQGQHGQNEADQRDHRANLADFYRAINSDMVFGTHSTVDAHHRLAKTLEVHKVANYRLDAKLLEVLASMVAGANQGSDVCPFLPQQTSRMRTDPAVESGRSGHKDFIVRHRSVPSWVSRNCWEIDWHQITVGSSLLAPRGSHACLHIFRHEHA